MAQTKKQKEVSKKIKAMRKEKKSLYKGKAKSK